MKRKKGLFEPQPELAGLIMTRIYREEKKLALKRVGAFSAVSVAGVLALIPTWNLFAVALSTSGFLNFSSLLFSDWSSVSAHVGDFIFSLAESLPIVELSLLLLVGSVLFAGVVSLISDLTHFKMLYE